MTERILPAPTGRAAPAFLTLALLLAMAAPVPAADVEEANKSLVREFYDAVLNGGDFAAVERYVAPGAGDGLDRASIEEIETFRRLHVPDLSYVIEEMVAEGDTVVVRLRETGTHTGTAKGIPATGESVDLRAVAIYRIEDGKIRSRWYLDDKMKLARTIGYRIEKPGS